MHNSRQKRNLRCEKKVLSELECLLEIVVLEVKARDVTWKITALPHITQLQQRKGLN